MPYTAILYTELSLTGFAASIQRAGGWFWRAKTSRVFDSATVARFRVGCQLAGFSAGTEIGRSVGSLVGPWWREDGLQRAIWIFGGGVPVGVGVRSSWGNLAA
jgi:hypothetical protein